MCEHQQLSCYGIRVCICIVFFECNSGIYRLPGDTILYYLYLVHTGTLYANKPEKVFSEPKHVGYTNISWS